MLTINSLKLFNFIKYKDQELSLKNKGLILLKGDNRDEKIKGASGAGKTIIGDAIHWLLSSRTTRKIRAGKVVGKSAKYAYVTAEVESNGEVYTVSRYRNHPKYGNSLRIVCGDDISHRKIYETEERLEKIIGCSFNLFRLSCFHNSDPKYHFSRMDSATRGKIIDEICMTTEANIPERAKKLRVLVANCDNDIRNINSEVDKNKFTVEEYTDKIDNYLAMINKEKDNYNTNVDNYKKDIISLLSENKDGLDKKIILIDSKIEEINKKNKKNTEIDKSITAIESKIHEYENKKYIVDNKISEIKALPVSEGEVNCDKCGNKIDKTILIALLKSRDDTINRLSKEKEIYLLNIKKHEEEINTLSESKYNDLNVDNLIKEKGIIEYEISKIHDNREKAIEKKNDLKKYVSGHNEYLSGINKDVVDCKKEINKLKNSFNLSFISLYKTNKRKDLLETLETFYGPSGFRPMVMNHYSPILSESANKYLSNFSKKERISISSKTQLASGEVRDKVEIQIIDGKKKKSFPEEFSCGEGQAIDISMNFGVMALAAMKASMDFGFLYLDESTAGLSSTLVDKLIEVIKKDIAIDGRTVIMTTHRPVDEGKFDNIWTAIKENDLCRVEAQ